MLQIEQSSCSLKSKKMKSKRTGTGSVEITGLKRWIVTFSGEVHYKL